MTVDSPGGTAGSAGSFGGTSGSGGTGGSAGAPVRQPAPPWQPPFALGAPGWRNSTSPFCTEHYGLIRGPQLWSDSQTTFALLRAECNVLADVPCGGEGASLYANSGEGWRLLRRFAEGAGNRRLTGFPGGPLLMSTGHCGIARVERAGNISCSWRSAGPTQEWVDEIFAVPGGRAYALINQDLEAQRVLALANDAWTDFAPLTTDPLSTTMTAGPEALVVADYDGRVERGTAPGLTPIAGAPAGGCTAIWTFGKDVWLANRVGELVHFDGTSWHVVPTGIHDELLGLWGSDDGILYFYSVGGFGRWNGEPIELFANGDVQPTSRYFTGIWGNSANEVFLSFVDNTLRGYACSGAFVLYFDGSQLHRL